MEDGTHLESWECWLPSKGHLVVKNIPPGLLSKIENKSGEFTLFDAQAEVNGDSLELSQDVDVDKIVKPKRNNGNGNGNRKLAVVTGNKSILAVRVVAPDATTTSSVAAISDSIFGTNGDPVNLKSQYAVCSNNLLSFNPTTNSQATNGVYQVTISQTVTGIADSTVRNAVTSQLTSDLGNLPSQFDHVMLCLPAGTSGSWIAYAYVNSWLSVYNNQWCGYVSGQVHELGHNLNLGEFCRRRVAQ